MWTRKELKKNARGVMRKNYWAIVAVSFILSIFIGSTGSSWMLGDNGSEEAVTEYESVEQSYGDPKSNEEVVSEFIENITGSETPDAPQPDSAAGQAVNNIVTENLFDGSVSKDTFVRLLHSINSVINNDYTELALTCAGLLLGMLFIFLFCNVLDVGGKRFFLETRKYTDTQIRRLFFPFFKGRWKNTAWVMFCRSFFLFLWQFTIIGWFIKSYQYIMVPYIVAENPYIERKHAFMLSKQMMRGSKWRTFVFQMSFIGWIILGIFTLGLFDIFYVMPYMNTGMAELYMNLRNKAIEEKFEYYEDLNDTAL